MVEMKAYFDNAATTFPKPADVYDFADSFYRGSGGSIGRGGNALAVAAGEISRQAKDNLRSLYGCPMHEVVFTSSATDALNRILLGIDYLEGDNVYLTPFEHNAVTRPLNHLTKAKGIELHLLPFDERTLCPNLQSICDLFEEKPPKLVVLNHASNVCGAVIPVELIASIAKRFGATTVIDMSQTAGLLKLDLGKPDIDFAVFAGHKTLFAPFGIGGFFCRRGTRLKPVFFGGNGINSVDQDLPDGIVQMEEIGSQNTYAIAGLKASTDWILSKGMDAVFALEKSAGESLSGLLGEHANCHVIAGDALCDRIGVFSAVFDGYSPDEIEQILGRMGVAVRSGLQCAPYCHRFLKTLPNGTVRFSVSALTSQDDLSILGDALDFIERNG